jgi:hypothetical protein
VVAWEEVFFDEDDDVDDDASSDGGGGAGSWRGSTVLLPNATVYMYIGGGGSGGDGLDVNSAQLKKKRRLSSRAGLSVSLD